jgi:hypothetical protein
MKSTIWTIEEVHGIWWAYEPPRPPDEKFVTHGRSQSPCILGPFHCREVAEKKLEEVKGGRVS